MVLSRLNIFSSDDSDEEENPMEHINTSGGSENARKNSSEDVDEEDSNDPVVEEKFTDDEGEELEMEELPGKDVPEVGEHHKDIIAPSGITPKVDTARVGEEVTRTYFINGWPDEPEDAFLDEVLLQNDVKCDISIHISPFDSVRAEKQLKKDAFKAKEYAEDATGGGFMSGLSQREDYQETLNIYEAIRKTNVELFDVGLYLTVRGETEREVVQASKNIKQSLQSSPALTRPEIAKRNQKLALQTVSPLLADQLEYKTEMLGGAIGAMFPFSTKTIYEEGGVDFGKHAGNGSPVIVNRFEARNLGYNQLTIGDIGSGKSFSSKLNLIRTYANRDDVEMFIIDPLSGFESVNKLLGGTAITVGGSLTLNPLEISRTPEEVLERQPDADPYGTQIKKVMDFFEMFFGKQNLKLGENRITLQRAVEGAYEEKGITQDVTTHGRPSPTVQDVVRIIEEMVENPEDYAGLDSEVYHTQLEEQASSLAAALQQFKEGRQYSNLGGNSEISFSENDVHYLDLSQQEGSGTFGIIMHILLSEVYEHSKQTDKNVMLLIDEAHYLMNDAESLEYLTHIVRHSRHHNMSINFVTQSIEDFFDSEASKTIADETSLKLFQKMPSGMSDEIANILDLTPQERRHIRNAQAGDKEKGYSEALIGVEDKGYYPIQVVPSEFEASVLNYEPKNQPDTDIVEVANSIDGVNISQRDDVAGLKEDYNDDEESIEFGSEERMNEIKQKYGLTDDSEQAQETPEVTPDEMQSSQSQEETGDISDSDSDSDTPDNESTDEKPQTDDEYENIDDLDTDEISSRFETQDESSETSEDENTEE